MTAGGEETIDCLQDFDLQVIQPKTGYRFSLDPLLLCDFAPADGDSIVDLGCGCGIIPLVMARRSTAARIVAVELQPAMAGLAASRVSIVSGLPGRPVVYVSVTWVFAST